MVIVYLFDLNLQLDINYPKTLVDAIDQQELIIATNILVAEEYTTIGWVLTNTTTKDIILKASRWVF